MSNAPSSGAGLPEHQKELASFMEAQFADLRRFMDRRIAEVSAEVSASVQLMELQEEGVHRHLAEVRDRLSAIADAAPQASWLNGGMELEFVSVITEKAANEIMDVAEQLSTLSTADLSDPMARDRVRLLSARLFEACSFQDLVGQRVKRVVLQLREAEKVITEAVGDDGHAPGHAEEGEVRQAEVDRMLADPGVGGSAQADIDKLFD